MNSQLIGKQKNMSRYEQDGKHYEPAVLVLTEDGMIQDCNDAGEKLLGYRPGKMGRQHISGVLPRLSKINLFKGKRVNPYLRFLSRIGHPFEVIGNDSIRFSGELFFNNVENAGGQRTVVMIHPVPVNQAKNLH